MKIGDLVRKKKGHEEGNIAIIVKIAENSYIRETVKILTVYYTGQIKNWYSNYVEVINEK